MNFDESLIDSSSWINTVKRSQARDRTPARRDQIATIDD